MLIIQSNRLVTFRSSDSAEAVYAVTLASSFNEFTSQYTLFSIHTSYNFNISFP